METSERSSESTEELDLTQGEEELLEEFGVLVAFEYPNFG